MTLAGCVCTRAWSGCIISSRWVCRLHPRTRETAETLTRAITVHWGWVQKKMMVNLQMVGYFNITKAVEQFDKLVKSTAQYTTMSIQVFMS